MPTSDIRTRLLIVLHAYHNRAGTEQHAKILARGLQSRYRVGIVFPQKGTVVFREEESGEEFAYPGQVLPWPVAPYRAPIIEQSLKQILERFNPHIIHIQHNYEWPLSVIDTLTGTGKPVLMSFHEYYAITPYFTMEGVTDPRQAFSSQYVLSTFKQDIRQYLFQRTDVLKRSFERLAKRIVPSNYLASVLTQIYPGEYTVIPHGIEPFGRVDTVSEPPLRFGYVGSLLPQKGWETIIEPFLRIHQEFSATELHVFGGGQRYSGPPLPGITFHGVYDPPDLPQVCSQFHVGIIPSVFAETYSLTLSELWEAGRIAAVSDIGVFQERIQDGVNGKKFLAGDAKSIEATFRYFLTNDTWRAWTIPSVRHADEMCQEYDVLYQSLLSSETR